MAGFVIEVSPLGHVRKVRCKERIEGESFLRDVFYGDETRAVVIGDERVVNGLASQTALVYELGLNGSPNLFAQNVAARYLGQPAHEVFGLAVMCGLVGKMNCVPFTSQDADYWLYTLRTFAVESPCMVTKYEMVED